MFPTSSQKKYWTFTNEKQLNRLRVEQNAKFIETHGDTIENTSAYFLTPGEERLLLRQYEIYLMDFCHRFEPAMPKCVVGTSFHYFKRFYLNNSPMDFHPKEILATCAYLACKVEEFNVSISQFLNNIKGDRNKATDIVLTNELLLMQHLNYYLTIHNPYRPIEGFLIDIKTKQAMKNPERLRPLIDAFMESVLLTDAILLYSPSQIALAAVLHSASKEQENLDKYVTDELLNDKDDKLKRLIDAVRKIRLLVKTYQPPGREQIKYVERKLEICRNQDNNPDSEAYKERMSHIFSDDDDTIEIVESNDEASNLNSN